MTLLIGGALRDGVNLLRDFVETPAEWFAQVFDFFMDILLRILSFFVLVFHEISLEFLAYTPYPGRAEGEQHIFTTPDSGSAFYTMITFSNDFIEPFALLMVFFGIIFILFIRIFDIMIQDFGVNTQEGMKRLFIAPIIIVLWMPLANLLLFFTAGMTDWLLSVELSGVDEIIDDEGGLDAAEDGELNVESYINALGRNEDVNVISGTLQSLYGVFYGLFAIGIATILYAIVVFAAAIRIIGVYGFYALAPIGVVLWSFKWRGFAKLGGQIIRYFILFAIFPIGVAFLNLMAPPLLFALQNVMDDVFDELAFTVTDPLSDPDDPTEINVTDVISTEEAAAFIFIILTPILIGIVPWGIIIGFDKAMKAAGVAAAGSVLAAGTIATGGAGLATIGAAKGGWMGASMAKSAAFSGLSRGRKAISKGASRAQKEYKAFDRATKDQKIKMAKSYGGSFASTIGKNKNRVKSRGGNIREGYMNALGSLNDDDGENSINSRIDNALTNPKETFINSGRKVGGGAIKGTKIAGGQMGRVRKRIGSGYGRAKFMSSRLVPDDLKSIRGVEDRVADSKVLRKYGGRRARLLQKGAKYHRDTEKGISSAWDDILAANEEYKYRNEDGTGGYAYKSRNSDDGLIPSGDSGDELIKSAEFKTLGEELIENENLVGEFSFRAGLSEDSVTEELLADKFFEYLRSPDKELSDIFSKPHADEAREAFINLSTEDVQKTLRTDSELKEKYKENQEVIHQVEKEKYNNDDKTNTLLEREYRQDLYDESEAHIEGLNDDVSKYLSKHLEDIDTGEIEVPGEDISIDSLNVGTKPSDVFAKNIADEIAKTDGSKQEIGNVLDRNDDVENLNKEELQGLVDSIYNGLEQEVKNDRLGDNYLDVNISGKDILEESKKSYEQQSISVQNLDNTKGESAANFKESTEIISEGDVSQDELRKFLGNSEFIIEGTAGKELQNALSAFENSMEKIQEEYNLQNRDFTDELMDNKKLLKDVIKDMKKGNIDDEHNLYNMIENSMEHVNNRANDSQEISSSDIEQTVEAMIKIEGKDIMGIDKSRIDNLERGLEAQIKQNHENLMNSLTNEKSKEVVNQYQNSDDNLNDVLRNVDASERSAVVNELTDLKFGDLDS